eukprot:5048130-Pyramimonas_sp.AAC.2
MGSVWGRYGVGMGSVWGPYGVGMGSVWGPYGVSRGVQGLLSGGKGRGPCRAVKQIWTFWWVAAPAPSPMWHWPMTQMASILQCGAMGQGRGGSKLHHHV